MREIDAAQDQDVGLMPDFNNLPDDYYVQDELEIRANDEERPILEEIAQLPVVAEPQPL